MASGLVAKLAAVVIAGLIPHVALAQSPITDPEDLPRLYAEAMAASDVETIVSFYAEDAILMTPEGPVAAGSEAIRQLMARNFAGGATLGMRFNQAQIDGGGGRAVTVWDWNLTIAAPGRDPIALRVRSMIYLKQQGETWSIAADMYQVIPE